MNRSAHHIHNSVSVTILVLLALANFLNWIWIRTMPRIEDKTVEDAPLPIELSPLATSALVEANNVGRANQAALDIQLEQESIQTEALRREAKKGAGNALRPAQANEYDAWLKDFLSAGGEITHYYDYPMSRWQFEVAEADFRLPKLTGAMARHIIVSDGVEANVPELGHTQLFYLADGSCRARSVPAFIDQLQSEIPSVRSAARSARAHAKKAEQDFRTEIAQRERETKDKESQFNKIKRGKLGQAGVGDYRNWLNKFVEAGGQFTHSYDYRMPTENWYVAKKSFTMVPLHGASSVNIIVPEGVTVDGEIGHSNLFFLSDGSHKGSFVPAYSNLQYDPQEFDTPPSRTNQKAAERPKPLWQRAVTAFSSLFNFSRGGKQIEGFERVNVGGGFSGYSPTNKDDLRFLKQSEGQRLPNDTVFPSGIEFPNPKEYGGSFWVVSNGAIVAAN